MGFNSAFKGLNPTGYSIYKFIYIKKKTLVPHSVRVYTTLEFLRSVNTKTCVFLDVTPYSLVQGYKLFRLPTLILKAQDSLKDLYLSPD